MSKDDEEIDDIIQHLLHLHIEETRLLQRLANLRSQRQQEDTGRRAAAAAVEPDQARSRTLVDADRSRAVRNNQTQNPTAYGRRWRVGDRVRITNRIRVGIRLPNEADRLATITNITSGDQHDDTRVYIRTDNGTTTWRLRKHLLWVNDEQNHE